MDCPLLTDTDEPLIQSLEIDPSLKIKIHPKYGSRTFSTTCKIRKVEAAYYWQDEKLKYRPDSKGGKTYLIKVFIKFKKFEKTQFSPDLPEHYLNAVPHNNYPIAFLKNSPRNIRVFEERKKSPYGSFVWGVPAAKSRETGNMLVIYAPLVERDPGNPSLQDLLSADIPPVNATNIDAALGAKLSSDVYMQADISVNAKNLQDIDKILIAIQDLFYDQQVK